MREFRTSIEVDAPMETAWGILAAVDHWPDWTATVSRVEPLDAAPAALGKRVRVYQPKLRPAVWTITEWRPPHAFVWVANSPGLRMTAGHELGRRGAGCTLVLTMTFAGILAPVAARIGGRLAREYMEIEAKSLKARSESLAGAA